MLFESYFWTILEALKKTSEEYYDDKYSRLETDVDDEIAPLIKPLLANAGSNITSATYVMKTDQQMEYFLYWQKCIVVEKLIDIIEDEIKNESDDEALLKNLFDDESISGSDKAKIARMMSAIEILTKERKKLLETAKKRGMSENMWTGFVKNSQSYFLISRRFVDDMQHFFSLGIHDINTYNFNSNFTVPTILLNRLGDIEEAYFNKFQGLLLPTDLHDTEEIVTEFTIDGKKYHWANLHQSQTTTKEAKLMGHCGNSYHASRQGDEVYALRMVKTLDTKGEAYEPLLTFVVNNQTLRESKGHANDKPSKKYHEHIIKLFETGHITRIFQKDTYKKENNFYFDDLTDEEQDRITDKLDSLGVDYEFDYETMNWKPMLIEGEKRIDEFNRQAKFVQIYSDTDTETVRFDGHAFVTCPLFTEENREQWENYLLNHFEPIASFGVTPSIVESSEKYGVEFTLSFNEYFNLENGDNHKDSSATLTEVFNDAIQMATHYDRDLERTLKNMLMDDLLKDNENKNLIPAIDVFDKILNNYDSRFTVLAEPNNVDFILKARMMDQKDRGPEDKLKNEYKNDLEKFLLDTTGHQFRVVVKWETDKDVFYYQPVLKLYIKVGDKIDLLNKHITEKNLRPFIDQLFTKISRD